MRQEDIPADPAAMIRIGTVSAIDRAAGRCKLRYGDPDDEGGGAETPWIRWAHARAGATRSWSPPSLGEQMLLLAPDGQLGAAVAIGGLSRDDFPPPGADETELLLFADGARIAYDPVGHALSAVLPDGATATIEAPGGITLRGDVTVEGTLSATGDVTAGAISLQQHTHGSVQSGSDDTGQPQ